MSGAQSINVVVGELDGGTPSHHLPGLPDTVTGLLDAGVAVGSGEIVCVEAGAETRRSLEELRTEATSMLAFLRTTGVRQGDHLVLQAATAHGFLLQLWATFLGGIIPVVQPTVTGDRGRLSDRQFREIWFRLGQPTVISDAILADRVRHVLPELDANRTGIVVVPDTLPVCGGVAPSPGSPDSTALLMRTSGSTGAPKLVGLSHRNVTVSVGASVHVNGYDARAVSLNWLPLYHVGGLMRSLRETYLGCRQIQLAADEVRPDPLRWLAAIDHHRATMAWAPSVVFANIAERLLRLTTPPAWDLSCLHSLYTSGEPVTPSAMEAFVAACEPFGLPEGVMHVAWGMTEACFATASHTYLADRRATGATVADVGRPVPGVRLRVVDDDGGLRPPGVTGHLHASGPLVSTRYHDEGDRDGLVTPDGWLKTGDLAFVRDGRVTVVGRVTDLVSLGDVKYSPVEIEAALAGGDGNALPVAATCTVRPEPEAVEALAVFFRSPDAGNAVESVVHAIRDRAAQQFGVSPRFVLPWPEPASEVGIGKINRRELRRRFEAGELDAWRRWPFDLRAPAVPSVESRADSTAEAAMIDRILAVLERILGRVGLDRDANFFALGTTSLQVVQLAARLGSDSQRESLAVTDLFRAPTARLLARRMLGVSESGAAAVGTETGLARRARQAVRRSRRSWPSERGGGE